MIKLAYKPSDLMIEIKNPYVTAIIHKFQDLYNLKSINNLSRFENAIYCAQSGRVFIVQVQLVDRDEEAVANAVRFISLAESVGAIEPGKFRILQGGNCVMGRGETGVRSNLL